MCGIFGFKGKGSIKEKIINGLKDLEYRGYDSCGLYFKKGNLIIVNKKIGKNKVEELVKNIPIFSDEETITISHTRWATHGKISETNAHPQFDCKKEIFVVHNGIIENFQEIKEFLHKKGHFFLSETDTEVIPHLFEEFSKQTKDYKKVLLEIVKILRGSFAFLLTKKDENFICGARKESPLIIGTDEENFYFASDMLPILRYTDKFIFLNDEEVFFLTGKEIILFSFQGEKINRNFIKANRSFSKVSKESFESFMIKEIYEQPVAIKNTIENFISNDFEKILKKIDCERILMTGCGTSWHAGLVGKYMIEEIAKIPVEVEYASELRYREPVIDKNTILIPISQSGETADTLGVVRKFKNKCKILSICNVENSSLTRESDFTIFTKAGPEIGVASTKAFTTQLTILYLIALTFSFKNNYISGSKLYEKFEELIKIPSEIEKILVDVNIEKIAEIIYKKTNVLYLGRGINFPIALEGALKLKEVSYIHAEGYPAAEMKHGPIALIDENMPVIFISVKDKLMKKVLSNMAEVKTRKGFIICITDDPNELELKNLSDRLITIPYVENEYLKPILTVVPLQLIAYYVAIKKGLDVDKPRNLAKSVTVE